MRILFSALGPALVGCGGDLSNQLFEEDAEFAAALPDAEQLTLTRPDDAGGAGDDAAVLFALTAGTLSSGQQVLDGITSMTAQAVATPPTERGDDYRVWGPVPSDDNPDYFLRIEMTRSSTGAAYTYALQIAETSAGPWWELVSGTHLAGPEDVALGTGSIDIFDLASGEQVEVGYDLRGLRSVQMGEVVAAGSGQAGLQWTWTEHEDGGGGLAYIQPADAIGKLSSVNATELALDATWLVDGSGRGVARLSGGAYAGSDVELVQCWDSTGAPTWSWDNAGYTEPLGDESACAL